MPLVTIVIGGVEGRARATRKRAPEWSNAAFLTFIKKQTHLEVPG